MKPLAIDLYCGLGGWTEGLLDAGWDVVGFDIERHIYGNHRYPAQLVLQDTRTLRGAQFKDAALIVASPPCQKFSYMAMPWTRAKELAKWYRDPGHPERMAELTELFDACFRIQREASEAAGRRIPMVAENVCGAQPWVGRARWHYGSYYLWGDVPALMPTKLSRQDVRKRKSNFHANERGEVSPAFNGGSWFAVAHNTTSGHSRNPDGRKVGPGEGTKVGGGWFHDAREHTLRRHSSKSSARKAASARIAKIPRPLAEWIAHCYYPRPELVEARA